MSNLITDSTAYISRKFSEIKSTDLMALSGIVILLTIIVIFLFYDKGAGHNFYSLAETFSDGTVSNEATKVEISNVDAASIMLEKANKIFLIVFHDKQCPHCNDYLQTNGQFEKLAKKIQQDKALHDKVIVRITGKSDVRDYIEDQLPISIEGYPTIIVATKKGKLLVAEELLGGRSADSIFSALKEFEAKNTSKN